MWGFPMPTIIECTLSGSAPEESNQICNLSSLTSPITTLTFFNLVRVNSEIFMGTHGSTGLSMTRRVRFLLILLASA